MHKFIQMLKDRYIQFLNLLQIDSKVSIVDSWMSTDNKFVKTYDFQAYMPYEQRHLEVLNLSNNSCENKTVLFSREET